MMSLDRWAPRTQVFAGIGAHVRRLRQVVAGVLGWGKEEKIRRGLTCLGRVEIYFSLVGVLRAQTRAKGWQVRGHQKLHAESSHPVTDRQSPSTYIYPRVTPWSSVAARVVYGTGNSLFLLFRGPPLCLREKSSVQLESL